MAGSVLFDPRVSSHLIADEGEIIIDEVRRHPMAFVVPLLIAFGGALIMIGTLWVPVSLAWFPLLVGLAVVLIGAYRTLTQHMDRFVITNMRVFRVHGIFSQHTATMPMSRILDISVHKPFVGRLFGYGHFVFESAAQDQGLRDIRWVGHPDQRDLTIQRVIQRSGLRSSVRPLSSPQAVTPSTPSEFEDESGDRDPTDGSEMESVSSAWSARDEADHLRARGNG